MASRQLTSHYKDVYSPSKGFQALIVTVFLFLVCLLGFILIVGFRSNHQVSPAYTYAMQTRAAYNADPTPTPFQPEAFGYVPNVTPEPIVAADPEVWSSSIAPVNLEKPEGQINVLLLGTDLRENEGGFRTDTIVWVSLNPKEGFVSAISFPRDLYVQIPGYGENRINTAFGWGGFSLLADTMEINFGVRPDNYVLIHMNGFKSVIDSLGGINVEVEENLSDSCAIWINESGWCSVGPGTVNMNADVALWYVRSRYSTSDVDRARRAQEVVEAIFRRLMSLDVVFKVPELYNAYTSYVQTDIEVGKVIAMLPLANTIYENGDIRNYVVGFEEAYSWVTAAGASVLVPNNILIQELLIEALQLK
ncbi:MAG TPA: LCP family protein [Brevefilum fermentans]|jgi:LCP family protein required for cell wall assembly|uniref:LytR family transcriptional protein n=1 Tax=Candidatus Brevifilum fermentans TaxID=1986204 RepID=A0A1Y6K5F7_9CHLR|nr:LCP family protein [Brevefilum fermentans]MDI9566406.1 LCP family protein [Chloroflexota bacterium]OQB82907.1 MAG: Regulatory protein MsrR [Chloroflexi bacterium ADurb.Bin120]SMX54915.1 LytR family transcriptional protein [Brevefilum fermentans]HOM67310.1 LCP family protein [Brevefilum fermentans]HQA27924.1 LCP family protein [Brevefilum fermentans]